MSLVRAGLGGRPWSLLSLHHLTAASLTPGRSGAGTVPLSVLVQGTRLCPEYCHQQSDLAWGQIRSALLQHLWGQRRQAGAGCCPYPTHQGLMKTAPSFSSLQHGRGHCCCAPGRREMTAPASLWLRVPAPGRYVLRYH